MVRIKRVHHEGAIDFDRFGIVFAVEEDTSAETTHGRLSRLVQHGVRPERHDTVRRCEFFVFVLPGEPHLVEVQRRAPTGSQSYDKEQYEHGQRLDSLSDHRLGSFHEFGVWGP
jgi:hypothetical protein